MILGVDTGGTFTDFTLLDLSDNNQPVLTTHKVLSSPGNPELAILQGIEEMGLQEAIASGELRIIHGSTVATNAALENKGVNTVYISNKGFADVLTIGRQTRPSLYELEFTPIQAPVTEELCLEIDCRMDFEGNELNPIKNSSIDTILQEIADIKPDAIAINMLFSYLNPAHEVTLEEALKTRLDYSPFICRSSYVLPEYREYERGIATWLNASLGPLVEAYLLRLEQQTRPAPVSVMQSTGGTISAGQAASRAVNLLLSGPAGGLAAASYLSSVLQEPQLITFDMGGTSTDVALIQDGQIQLSSENHIGPYPVAVPMIDMHTIGAGGGSIAYIDEGGLLQVGPKSAGANPGPACYDLGGEEATVSDANLVLGHLLADTPLAGSLELVPQKAFQAVAKLATSLSLSVEEAAAGIIKIANEHMARALRVVSVEKGYDPRQYMLCSFGGAGGLHICALADALEMTRAVVPLHAGVLSALGMLMAPTQRQASITHTCLLDELDADAAQQWIKQLSEQVTSEMAKESVIIADTIIDVSADLRYKGQNDCLTLSWDDNNSKLEENFHQHHKERYGHVLEQAVELVNFRVSATWQGSTPELERLEPATGRPTALKEHKLLDIEGMVPVYSRADFRAGHIITGPALISEKSATTMLADGWQAEVHNQGHLLLKRI